MSYLSDPRIVLGLWGFVSSGLIIYFLISLLTFLQTKQRIFLYYSFYNLLVLAYLTKTTILFSAADLNWFLNSRYGGLVMVLQIVYNSSLYLFYSAFLELKAQFPKQINVLNRLLLSANIITIIFYGYSILFDDLLSFSYFAYGVFVPLFTLFIFYAMYLSYKAENRLKYLMIGGILVYQVFAYTNVYFTIFTNSSNKIDPMVYLYIGLIFESMLFMVAMGFKVKQVYLEKINSQKRIIAEQIALNKLKEKYQKELEITLENKVSELKAALQKTEDEKLKSVTLTFENEIANLKLESLRSQMNPHFIFNVLNSIKAYLIDNDKEKAIYYLNKFSKLIRKILESSRTESISLEEELDIIQIYMSIENIRFDDKINFTINNNLTQPLSNLKLPGLILQPFIENALWHGLILKEGEKNITIAIIKEQHQVKLTITDNGIGRKKAKENSDKKTFKRESLGLQFAKERIDYFNKKQHTNYHFNFIDLSDDQNIPTGTKVEFVFAS